MKLCIDCKWYKEQYNFPESICTHEAAEHGWVKVVEYYSCSSMRAGICGKDSKYFAPKEPA